MRQNENRELALQASQKPKITIMKKLLYKVLSGGFYSQTPNTKNQKNQNQKQKLLQGTKREENQKGTNEVKKSKARQVNSGAGKAISQVAKISQPWSFSSAFCFSFLPVFDLQL